MMKLTKMTNLIHDRKRHIVLLFLMLFISQFAFAHEKGGQVEGFKFSEITCWDLMLLTEEQRPHALTLVYGYFAGISGKDMQDSKVIEATLNQTGKSCEKMPDEKVMNLMSKAFSEEDKG